MRALRDWTTLRLMAWAGVLACLGCCALAGTAAAARQRSVEVNGPGFWSLPRLGYAGGEVAVRLAQKGRATRLTAERTFAYSLPAGARQGPDRWYILDLHIVVTLRKDSGPGAVFVDGATNGWDAVQMQLNVAKDARGLTTSWNTYDLVDGARRGRESGASIVLDERNYLVDSGVQPGVNKLAIRIEQYQGARVAAARALPDSGIAVTTVGVPTTRLDVAGSRQAVATGDSFRLNFILTGSGATVKQASVYPIIDPKLLQFVSPAVRTYRAVRGVVRGQFEFKALKAGHTKIVVRALSNADNQPYVEVAVRIDPAAGEASTAALVATAVCGLLFAFAGTSPAVRRSMRIMLRCGGDRGPRA